MLDKQDTLNDLWALTLVDSLIQLGVHSFCLSPGSRSTPLALAVSKKMPDNTFVHFDERSMAFHALGIAKATKKAVVIITTSGTACGNILPAIMEAFYSHLPLIILTADRPPELQDCGANQAAHQTSMFTSFVQWETHLPCPTRDISLDYIRSTISYAVAKATGIQKGPVHINWMLREPLFSHHPTSSQFTAPPLYLSSYQALDEESFETICDLIAQSKQGIILAGYDACYEKDSEEFLLRLSHHLTWPLYADIASGMRNHLSSLIPFDLILKNPMLSHELKPDVILHVGGQLVSKGTGQWLQDLKPTTYIHLSPFSDRQDPCHLQTHRIVSQVPTFCKTLLTMVASQNLSPWWDKHQMISHLYLSSIEKYFHDHHQLNEVSLFYFLSQLDLSSYGLFISNSMPIRDAEMLFFSTTPPHCISSLRGLSGIDGIIATSIGAAKGLNTPLIAVLGDQAALHDITSLAQLKDLRIPPITFIVVNNFGGGVFSFLPISKTTCAEKKQTLETYFAASHSFRFAKMSEAFQIDYHHISTSHDFLEILSSPSKKHRLIEINTERDQNVLDHENLYSYLNQSITSMESSFDGILLQTHSST